MVVVPLRLKTANMFVLHYHRHNDPVVGYRFAIGAMHDNELIGVAIVGRPIARNLDNGFTAEVLRTCTNDKAPKGAVSFLYSACWRIWREMGGKKLVTYTLQTESGASLRGAGWTVIAELTGQKGGWKRKKRPRYTKHICEQDKLRWERRLNDDLPGLEDRKQYAVLPGGEKR